MSRQANNGQHLPSEIMPRPCTRLIAAAIEQGDFPQARRHLEQALEQHPHCPLLWSLLGWVHFGAGNMGRCVDAMEHASLIAPLDFRGRVVIATAYGRVGRRSLARDLLCPLVKEATGVDLDYDVALLLAWALADNGRPDLALKICRRAAEIDSLRSESYYHAGVYGARLGLPDHTVEALLRRAISLEPERADYRAGLATHLLRTDRTEAAIQAIADLTPAEIRSIACRSCLEHVAEVFELAGDWRRVVLCRERLLVLEIAAVDDSGCGGS